MPAAGPQNTRKTQRKRVVKAKPVQKAKPTNNAQTYVSQGKAVERVANTQKARVRRRRAEVKDTKSSSDLGRAKTYKKTDEYKKNKAYAGYKAYTYAKKRGRGAEQIKKSAARGDEQAAAIAAPVLRVLDQTTRVNHAIMGAARKDVAEFKKHGPIGLVGHGSLKEAGKGIQNKTKYTGSDVLKDAGVKNKTVRGIAGFVADVGLDPTTYVTGGSSAVAKHAGEKAAVQAEKKAAKIGLSEPQVKRFGERARAQAEKAAPEGKRVTVKAGSIKASVKAPKVKAPQKVKDVVADVNPNAAPAGVKKATSDKAIAATRTARAKTGQGERDAVRVAHGIRKQVGEENYNAVVDAIEAGKIGRLPEHLRGHAVTLRSEMKHVRRVQRRAGVKVADVAGGRTKLGPVPERRVIRKTTEPTAKFDVRASHKALLRRAAQRNPELVAEYRQIYNRMVADLNNDTRVIDVEPLRKQLNAIEKKLGIPHDLAPLAEDTRNVYRVEKVVGTKSGRATRTTVKEKGKGEVKGYVYRQLTKEAEEQQAKRASKSGGLKPASSKARKEKRPMAVIREESPGKYREDLHALSAERLAHGTKSGALADLNRSIADLGRPVKRGKVPDLKEGEAVYHIKAGEPPREVHPKSKELAHATQPLTLNKKGSKVKYATPKRVGAGRYVVLNKDVVKRALEGANPQLQGPGIVHAFDKATGGFKRIALATPGFHIRNIIGDTFQAYVKQPAHELPGNLNKSRKVLKALDKEQVARENLTRPKPSGETIKTGKYGHVPLEEIAHRLVQAGAARSGYTARELRELSQSGGVKEGGKVRQTMRKGRKAVGSTRPAEFSKRLLLNREDLPRIASAIYALKHGATWEEAASKVAETHFDYGHLTSFERNVARRILPFYTWSARNIPFTAKNVVARPGKYANFQKVRENAAKMSGADQEPTKSKDMYDQLRKAGVDLPKGWEKTLSEWEQRNAGIPLSWNGQKFTLSAGLPLTDLNEFPGAAGKGQAREYYQKLMSLVNPIAKDPVEYFENHSFFFRDEIERQHSPLVAAPSYVKTFPESLRKRLGITDQYIDKKSGKKTWGWPGRLDYLAKAVPGTPNYLQQLSTGGTDRRGKTTGGKILAFSGIKSVPIDPAKNAVNLAYGRLDEIARAKAKLNQQGIGSSRSGRRETPEYRKLLNQEKILRGIAFQGKAEQGYQVMPTQGGPPKKRVRKTTSPQTSTGRFKLDGGSSSSSSSGSGSSGSSGRFVFR